MTKFLAKSIGVAALVWLLLLMQIRPVLAGDPIVLDSVFTDWFGEGSITDPTRGKPVENISQFWWADNDGESFAYWRLDRVGHAKGVTYVVYVDTNNDGIFTSNIDREVVVDYDPLTSTSDVDVTVRYADTDGTVSQLPDQDWGESEAEGGKFVEFRASFADLGIAANQTVRMYVESFKYQSTKFKDRAPDSGDIQWSPVDILGYPLLAVVISVGTLAVWKFSGRYAWARS